jgi:ankyrin repeat protein
VKIFLARYPQEVIALGSDALRLAAMMGHDAVVQLLIKHPMVSPNKLGMGHLAPTHLVMLEDVLDDGAERSTLSYAAEAGYTKIVRILLGSGQTAVDRPDSRGRTPLYHAAAGGNADVVQLFLDCGACDLARKEAMNK